MALGLRGIMWLGESAQVWDEVCAMPAPDVSPEAANRGYRAVQAAEVEIQQAWTLHNGWNP